VGVFPFVDSHAHLTDSAFDADRAAVIDRARANGCRAVVCIGESLVAADKAMALAATQPAFLSATAGVHPHEAALFDAARDLDILRAHFANGAVAVGECGLDYHYDNSPREVQRAVFGAQIELARETSRPLVVHTRDAEADTIACIAEARSGGVIGVLHCFTGGAALAEAALAAGWYVSFAGVVTFKKWDSDALIRMVPDDRLLAETDSPYLTPAPFRGHRNEPSRVTLIVQRLAEVRGQTPAVTGALVTENARRCFGLALDADPV
jgi:TatD DNase family protein